MKNYLTIGEVSRLKGVGIKSLRYYDRLGILTPAYVNPENGYRYYTREQLLKLDLILLFIELGIPLREFNRYTDAQGRTDLPALLDTGRRSLRAHMAVLRGNLRKIDRIAETLKNFEEHGRSDAVYVRRIPERSILTAPWDPGDISGDQAVKGLTDLYFQSVSLGLTPLYLTGTIVDCRAGQSQWLLYTEVQGRCQHPSFRMLPAGQYRCRLENWKLDPIADMNLSTFKGLIVCEDIPGQNEEGLNIEIQMFEAKLPADEAFRRAE